jgi:capsular exopolysaccharide synthesis family protein
MDLNTQQEVHLSHYWHVIRKRWKIAFAILAVVMTATFLASYFSKPLYRSHIQIQIERDNPVVTIQDLFGIAASYQEFLQTQYILLKSRGLAVRVVEDHKLYNDRELYPQGVAGKTPEEIAKVTESLAGQLVGGVEVQPVHGTSLVRIFYTGTSPQLAQKVAEAWGESFMRMNIESKLESVQMTNEFLSRQIAEVTADLNRTQQELQQYGQDRGIISVGEGETVSSQKLVQLSSDVTAAQSQVFNAQAAYNTLRQSAPETVVAGDVLVSRHAGELAQLERQYSDQQANGYLPDHPTMRQLNDQINNARRAKASAVQQAYAKALENARAAVDAAQSKETSLRNAYNQQRGEVQKVNIDIARSADLRMAVDAKQALLGSLQKQLNETEVAARLSGSASSNVRWVDHAQVPGSRHNLSMKKNLQNAFPLGIILGLAAIFFLEYMDRSVKTPEDLEKVTGFASLGVIPSAGTVSKQYGYGYGYGRSVPKLRAVEPVESGQAGIELIPHTDARSPIAEAYRAFRTSLLLASAKSPKVIVITSSFAREGKTTTSTNLAVVLAQMGKPVLLVDADLRRPRLQKVFTGKMNLGLVNYLAANIPLEDIIQPTEVPNLSVVLSGPIPPNPSELLASDRMRHLIEEMREKFAYVIFDSPPVLAVTDAVVLGANADGMVLCAHGGQTPRDLVQRSSERLRQANIPVLGALLNNVDLQQYGYNYRKSYYAYYESSPDHESLPAGPEPRAPRRRREKKTS